MKIYIYGLLLCLCFYTNIYAADNLIDPNLVKDYTAETVVLGETMLPGMIGYLDTSENTVKIARKATTDTIECGFTQEIFPIEDAAFVTDVKYIGNNRCTLSFSDTLSTYIRSYVIKDTNFPISSTNYPMHWSAAGNLYQSVIRYDENKALFLIANSSSYGAASTADISLTTPTIPSVTNVLTDAQTYVTGVCIATNSVIVLGRAGTSPNPIIANRISNLNGTWSSTAITGFVSEGSQYIDADYVENNKVLVTYRYGGALPFVLKAVVISDVNGTPTVSSALSGFPNATSAAHTTCYMGGNISLTAYHDVTTGKVYAIPITGLDSSPTVGSTITTDYSSMLLPVGSGNAQAVINLGNYSALILYTNTSLQPRGFIISNINTTPVVGPLITKFPDIVCKRINGVNIGNNRVMVFIEDGSTTTSRVRMFVMNNVLPITESSPTPTYATKYVICRGANTSEVTLAQRLYADKYVRFLSPIPNITFGEFRSCVGGDYKDILLPDAPPTPIVQNPYSSVKLGISTGTGHLILKDN